MRPRLHLKQRVGEAEPSSGGGEGGKDWNEGIPPHAEWAVLAKVAKNKFKESPAQQLQLIDALAKAMA